MPVETLTAFFSLIEKMDLRGCCTRQHNCGAMNIKTQRSIYRQISKESEDIHMAEIDVGGGCGTGCASHPQSAERVDELEENVWSVVQQEIEREDQGEGVQNSGMTGTGVRGAETRALQSAQEKKSEVA